jgi:hypothetical protein
MYNVANNNLLSENNSYLKWSNELKKQWLMTHPTTDFSKDCYQNKLKKIRKSLEHKSYVTDNPRKKNKPRVN